ncbi:MAG TPA: sugar phosphate isomerase/epimerase family protein [Abditibacteriaceae bacterium]|jgi:sugar phosphate isomerase/epimerase|nr:sugar phosphate isomerase/epimerase family protein [Abditibacteriaceae bacterium]
MFKFCLNTSTLRGYQLTLREEIEVAARAGYGAVEPWISEMEAHEENGGTLEELGRVARDNGVVVQGAIGFFEWIVDDPSRRTVALERARRDMERVARLGGNLIAAPPSGATETSGLDLQRAAERYAALCEVGRQCGVRPLVEVWGFSQTLSRLGEAAFIAIESGHPDAGILADVYHLHKGGSPPSGLAQLNGTQMPLFHVNDYPAAPGREAIKDEQRIWPGDGVAPLGDILTTLRRIGFDGYLSLELFNPQYWQSNALETARTGLEKMQTVVNALDSEDNKEAVTS